MAIYNQSDLNFFFLQLRNIFLTLFAYILINLDSSGPEISKYTLDYLSMPANNYLINTLQQRFHIKHENTQPLTLKQIYLPDFGL